LLECLLPSRAFRSLQLARDPSSLLHGRIFVAFFAIRLSSEFTAPRDPYSIVQGCCNFATKYLQESATLSRACVGPIPPSDLPRCRGRERIFREHATLITRPWVNRHRRPALAVIATKVTSLSQYFDHVIDQLFASEDDRALARAWIARLDKESLASRVEAFGGHPTRSSMSGLLRPGVTLLAAEAISGDDAITGSEAG
jgi:hypothetical protein